MGSSWARRFGRRPPRSRAHRPTRSRPGSPWPERPRPRVSVGQVAGDPITRTDAELAQVSGDLSRASIEFGPGHYTVPVVLGHLDHGDAAGWSMGEDLVDVVQRASEGTRRPPASMTPEASAGQAHACRRCCCHPIRQEVPELADAVDRPPPEVAHSPPGVRRRTPQRGARTQRSRCVRLSPGPASMSAGRVVHVQPSRSAPL